MEFYSIFVCLLSDKDRNYYMIPDPVNDTEAFQELENKYGSYSFQPESTQFQIQTEFYKVWILHYIFFQTPLHCDIHFSALHEPFLNFCRAVHVHLLIIQDQEVIQYCAHKSSALKLLVHEWAHSF